MNTRTTVLEERVRSRPFVKLVRAPTAPTCPWLWNRTTVFVAWAALVLSLFHPPHGLGVRLCWLKASTGAPCWGCGLSRSFSCTVRGMFGDAWTYHPFGTVLSSLLLAVVVVSVLPGGVRACVKQCLDRYSRVLTSVYAVFVTGFLLFGLARAAWYLTRLAS